MAEKNKSLTVFKSDRHEDVAAIIFSGLIVVVVLTYMAFIVPSVSIKAPQDGKLVEIAEIRDHPFMVASQFHPEFLSRPMKPHPLFAGFVHAASEMAKSKPVQPELMEEEK